MLDVGVVLVTVLMMLAVGLNLPGREVREVLLRRRRAVFVLLGMQWLLLPLLGWAVARGLALPPHLGAALMLVAACPVGDIVGFYTLLARGSVALAVTLNAVSCLLAPASMALALAGFRVLGHDDGLFAVPGLPLVGRLLGLTLVPVAAGALLLGWRPALARRLSLPVQRATGVSLAALVALVLADQWPRLAAEWQVTARAAVVFLVAAGALGWLAGRLAGGGPARRRAITLSFPIRNIGLAAAVAVTMLDRPDYAAFAVVYFLVEVPLLALVALALRHAVAGAGAT